MVILLFQICLIIAIIIFIYALFLYLTGPERKLKQAQKAHTYYCLDDPSNSEATLRITYKGYLFTGIKQLGVAADAYHVNRIDLSVKDQLSVPGLTAADLSFLETKIKAHYPVAQLTWLPPLHRLSD